MTEVPTWHELWLKLQVLRSEHNAKSDPIACMIIDRLVSIMNRAMAGNTDWQAMEAEAAQIEADLEVLGYG